MSRQMDNVFLQIKDSKRKIWWTPCGYFADNKIKKIFNDIRNTDLSKAQCSQIAYAQITTITTEIDSFRGTQYKESYKLEILLNNPRLSVPCCDVLRSKNDCLRCIAAGNCHDEFIINTIGKRLFADKYQEKQK